MRILLIEDHRLITANVTDYLGVLGHEVTSAIDGAKGLKLALAGGYDVLVLDRMLPRMDGDEVCRRVRKTRPELPILMLTALDSTADKVAGFEAGADDYLSKPFALAELRVRLEALLRRVKPGTEKHSLRIGDLEFDLDRLTASRAGKEVPLNPTARKLLEHLMRESHRVVTREELERMLWGDEQGVSGLLRVHMHGLRAAVDGHHRRKLLQTVRGIGYRLADPDGI